MVAGNRNLGVADRIGNMFRRRRSAPTATLGAPGVAIFSGYVEQRERRPELASRELRYRTYADILANTSIVAAGVRYFLNLIANSEWSFQPTDEDTDGMFAERAEEILTDSPETPFHRIIRRTAMYRFYGFGIQEWTAMRHEEGWFTFKDIAPRAQVTIERWDTDSDGKVIGVVQRNPYNQEEIYLPRQKLLYVTDDSLSDTPEGLGLFRHLVEPAKRLERYEELEGYGFETDLRGIPIGYGPFTELAKMERSGEITTERRREIEKPMREFIEKHIRNPKLGLILDSMRYETADEAQRPSNNKQWEVELLSSDADSFETNAAAIERINRELARILGVEQILLGATSTGSLALSRDKSQAFFLLTDAALTDIREAVVKDLLKTAWMLNGWDEDLMPQVSTDAVRFVDAEQASAVLRDMASAGAVLEPDDPAINDLRDLIGVSHVDLEAQRDRAEADAAINREMMRARFNQPDEDDEGEGNEPNNAPGQ